MHLASTARLFDTRHQLAAHVSAIDYPVFVHGRNYAGASPPLTRHPVLRSLVRASPGARLAMAPSALVVPLGKAAQNAVEYLATAGLVDSGRCLLGFPHPSGANGWRARQYAGMRPTLTAAIARWAAQTNAGQATPPAPPPPGPPPAPTRLAPRPTTPAPGTRRAAQPSSARIVLILTEGSLRNSYVSLADHLDFFPPDALGAATAKEPTGAPLTLRLDGLPGSVQTDIAGNYKIFRCRGPWRRFFAHHSLTAGTQIAIERISAYEYRITPRHKSSG